ncbi:hypothetical protein SK128_011437, partial [Halocaridina rubra]
MSSDTGERSSSANSVGQTTSSSTRQRTVNDKLKSNYNLSSAVANGVFASSPEGGGAEDNNISCSNTAGCHSVKNKGSQCTLHLWSRKALLHRKDIPKHLQFNPYIETGYRPLLSMWGCVMSLFYFHNETINIITH